MTIPELFGICRGLGWGKSVAGSIYFRFDALHDSLQFHFSESVNYRGDTKNLIARIDKTSISLVEYDDLDGNPHPVTVKGWKLSGDRISHWTRGSVGQIIHRKELMHPEGWPMRDSWAQLTVEEEAQGLYSKPCKIGHANYWRQSLIDAGVRIENGHLVKI